MMHAVAPILADSGLNGNVWVVVLAGAISFGVPLTLAALGEILAERSGVLNLGIEGMMLLGAVCAFLAGDAWHNPWLALAAGVLAGGALSLVHAFLCIGLRANQIVSGLALVIFGSGLASFVGQSVEGKPRGTHLRATRDPAVARHPDHRSRAVRPGRARLRDVARSPAWSRSTCSVPAPGSRCVRWGSRPRRRTRSASR